MQFALEIGHCVEWLMTTTPEVPENRGKRTLFMEIDPDVMNREGVKIDSKRPDE